MITSDLITAVWSGKLYLENITTIDSVPYFSVCVIGSHHTSKSVEFRDLKAFIRSHTSNGTSWWQRRRDYRC